MKIVTNAEIVKALIQVQTAQLLVSTAKEFVAVAEGLTEKDVESVMVVILAFSQALENEASKKISDIAGIPAWQAAEVQTGVFQLGEQDKKNPHEAGSDEVGSASPDDKPSDNDQGDSD